MTTSYDLFELRAPLDWLPDETLFGLCSRYHFLSGNHLSSSSCSKLFGHRTQGSAHDFPSRLEHFACVTNMQFGTADQIVLQHTILPFYFPFASHDVAVQAMAAMRSESIGSLKFQLGLLTSRFRSNHPLKACRDCILEDREEWSTSYWHRAHQFPGVFVCTKHGTPLFQSNLKSTGVKRFHWLLPAAAELPHLPLIDHTVEPFMTIAENAIKLSSLPFGTTFEWIRVTNTFRSALRERSLLRGIGKGRLVARDAGRAFAQYIAPLIRIVDFAGLPDSEDQAVKEIAKLINSNTGKTHPIRLLVMISWLFGNLESFLRQYGLVESPSEPNLKIEQVESAQTKSIKDNFFSLISAGLSVSGAARQLSVDPATGMAWAAAKGIKTQKRPRVIKGEVREKMIRSLRHGAAKSVAAKIAAVSEVSVTRLLRTEVGLQNEWRTARFKKAQIVARRRWTRAISNNQSAGAATIRILEPSSYAWLYRNDRDWLNAQKTQLNHPVRHSGLQVAWDARDMTLAKEIADVCLQLALDAPGKRIKLWQIYQRIPQLRAKLTCLNKLPKTQETIQRAIRSSSDNRTFIADLFDTNSDQY